MNEVEAVGEGVEVAVIVGVYSRGVFVDVAVASGGSGVRVGWSVLLVLLPGLGVGVGSVGEAVVGAVKLGSVVNVEPVCKRAGFKGSTLRKAVNRKATSSKKRAASERFCGTISPLGGPCFS